MKILKGLLILILVLLAVVLIVALFVKKDYAFERSVVINRPVNVVFPYLKMIKSQDYYSKWNQMDSTMKKSYSGTDGTVGFIYSWEGNSKVGKGSQEIKKIEEDKKVDIEVRFEKPFENTMQAYLTSDKVGDNQTKVSWGMSGHTGYPMNFMNLFIPSMMTKDLDTNLNNLKVLLEKQ